MKSNSIKRTDEETDELLNKCSDQENKGGSKYPGMTYEQGIQAGISWLLGYADENPLE
jgi:hypothetical protein